MKSEGKHPHLLQREMRRLTALCGTHYHLVKNQLDFNFPEFEGIKNRGLNNQKNYTKLRFSVCSGLQFIKNFIHTHFFMVA